jgi:opacity protein-like surface antigen
MKRLLVVALSACALAFSGLAATADDADAKKKCPEGTVFDGDSGKCVVDKGS